MINYIKQLLANLSPVLFIHDLNEGTNFLEKISYRHNSNSKFKSRSDWIPTAIISYNRKEIVYKLTKRNINNCDNYKNYTEVFDKVIKEATLICGKL